MASEDTNEARAASEGPDTKERDTEVASEEQDTKESDPEEHSTEELDTAELDIDKILAEAQQYKADLHEHGESLKLHAETLQELDRLRGVYEDRLSASNSATVDHLQAELDKMQRLADDLRDVRLSCEALAKEPAPGVDDLTNAPYPIEPSMSGDKFRCLAEQIAAGDAEKPIAYEDFIFDPPAEDTRTNFVPTVDEINRSHKTARAWNKFRGIMEVCGPDHLCEGCRERMKELERMRGLQHRNKIGIQDLFDAATRDRVAEKVEEVKAEILARGGTDRDLAVATLRLLEDPEFDKEGKGKAK
ncbi:hypothetical protein F4818DRAFT_419653 [Hypoxylon cercidicola]|nr:hypothetical protein F4818DRAFT_419653 [Hypoxylon cercidicola]